jgi:Na+-driven multidrug efflux pump
MVAILFIPIMIVLVNSDHLFRAIGFEEHICQHALTFIIYKSPHLFFFSIYDATKRLLYNTGYQQVPMYIQMGTTVLHPLWCYLFVHAIDLGIRGPALAASVSQIINMVCLNFYLGRI